MTKTNVKTFVELKIGTPSPEAVEAQKQNYMRCVDITTDMDIEPVLSYIPKSQIETLADLIKEKHPSWHIEVEPLHGGQKLTLLQHGEYVCDVVSHYYSYGGKEGLLEWWNQKKGTDPVGWLSAEEALELFEKTLEDKEETDA